MARCGAVAERVRKIRGEGVCSVLQQRNLSRRKEEPNEEPQNVSNNVCSECKITVQVEQGQQTFFFYALHHN